MCCLEIKYFSRLKFVKTAHIKDSPSFFKLFGFQNLNECNDLKNFLAEFI